MIELMLVLGIVLVVAAITVPRLAGSITGLRVSRGTERIFSAAREGRAHAVLRGLRTRLVLDPEQAAFWLEEERKPLTTPHRWSELAGREGKPYRLAEGVRFGPIDIDDETFEEERVVIRFLPDGSSSDALILIENEAGDRGLVEIRGVTGRSLIVPAEELEEVRRRNEERRFRRESKPDTKSTR
jgi:Tfp pilus assembly protein FimT